MHAIVAFKLCSLFDSYIANAVYERIDYMGSCHLKGDIHTLFSGMVYDNGYYLHNVLVTMICFTQVLHLLDSLGLSQYKEVFSREKIDGALLLDLDNEILEYELMMESKLHRLKLMRVISGKHGMNTPPTSPSRLLQNPV